MKIAACDPPRCCYRLPSSPPTFVKAIAENRLPLGIGLTRMMDLPSDWAEQRKALGLRSSP